MRFTFVWCNQKATNCQRYVIVYFICCVTPLFKWQKFQWNTKSGRNPKMKEMQRTCQRKVCKEVKLVTRDFCAIYVCLNVSGNAAIKTRFFGLFILCSNDCTNTHTNTILHFTHTLWCIHPNCTCVYLV